MVEKWHASKNKKTTHIYNSTDGNRMANDKVHSINDNEENYMSLYLRIECILFAHSLLPHSKKTGNNKKNHITFQSAYKQAKQKSTKKNNYNYRLKSDTVNTTN